MRVKLVGASVLLLLSGYILAIALLPAVLFMTSRAAVIEVMP